MSRKHKRNKAAAQMRAVPPGTLRPIQHPRPPAPPRIPGTTGQYPGMNLQGMNTTPAKDYQPFQSPGNLVMPPGDPIRPAGGLDDSTGGPRQWPYPVGTNVVPQPRYTEQVPFQQLRNLAALYDGVQLCEMAIERVLQRLEPQIVVKPECLPEGENASDDKWAEPARYMLEWWMEPDHRGTDLHSWMTASMNDILEIDALGIYHRRTRGGGLYGLEYVAGDSIALLLDAGGRRPIPPAPAYYQVNYGVPAVLMTANELDYLRVRARTTSQYGRSPVEAIILRINQALRKQNFDLVRFTDGATPMGVLETENPQLLNMKPADVLLWQDMWNAVLAGNDSMRVRTKAVPPGWSFKNLQIEDVATALDELLLNITFAAFGMTKDELGFTDTSNRAVGQMQENVIYRNVVKPRSDFFGNYNTRVMARYDGQPISPVSATLSIPGRPTKAKQGVWDARYKFGWVGIEEPEDFKAKADAISLLTQRGVIGPTKAQRLLKIPVDKNEEEIPAFVVMPNGGSVVFLEDALQMRESVIQEAKNRASGNSGTQQSGPGPALSAPLGVGAGGGTGTLASGADDSGRRPAGAGGRGGRDTGAQGASGGSQQAEQQRPGGSTDSGSAATSGVGSPKRPAHRFEQPERSASGIDGERPDAGRVEQRPSSVRGEALSEEWRRFRDVALRALKRGRLVPDFLSEILPPDDHAWVARRLARCTTPDAARVVFAAAQQREILRAQVHTGVMVAFFVPPDIANQLALPDGEEASELHVTLAYLGDVEDYTPEQRQSLAGAVALWAKAHAPLSGRISGLGRFGAADTEVEPVVALVDVPGLPSWREELVHLLEMTGCALDGTHGFTPHVTLAYVAKDDETPTVDVPDVPVTFDTLWLCMGEERLSFPLAGSDASVVPSQPVERAAAPAPKPLGKLTPTRRERINVPPQIAYTRSALAADALAIFRQIGQRGHASLS